MKKRPLFGIISASLSCVIVIYCIAVLIIDFKLQYYPLDLNANIGWTVLLICMCIGNLALMILSKSRVAYHLSMLSLLPYMCLINNKFMMFAIPIIYLAAYIIQKKWSIKIIGTIICAMVLLIVAVSSYASDTWSQSIETVEMNYYLSPDGETEVRVEVSYWFEKIEDNYDTYMYSVTVHEENIIDLGPLVFDGSYHQVYDEEMLSEKPNIKIEWIDNDTFLINGQQYSVADYIS